MSAADSKQHSSRPARDCFCRIIDSPLRPSGRRALDQAVRVHRRALQCVLCPCGRSGRLRGLCRWFLPTAALTYGSTILAAPNSWTKRFENGRDLLPVDRGGGSKRYLLRRERRRDALPSHVRCERNRNLDRPVAGEYLTGITANATGAYVIGLGASGPFLSRYDAGGNQIWTRAGIAGWIQRIAVDTDGIYAAGVTRGALPGQCAAGSSDAFVTRFDMDGKELWTRQFGTLRYEDVAGIALDAGNIFVAGSQFAGEHPVPGSHRRPRVPGETGKGRCLSLAVGDPHSQRVRRRRRERRGRRR